MFVRKFLKDRDKFGLDLGFEIIEFLDLFEIIKLSFFV